MPPVASYERKEEPMIPFDLRAILITVRADPELSDDDSQEISDSLSSEALETTLIDNVIEAVPAKYRNRIELEITT